MILDSKGARVEPIPPSPSFPAFFQGARARIPSLEEAELLNFESKMDLIWTHFRYPQLFRTNNIIEGIIDKLKHKITDCHDFTSPKTTWNCIKMIIMNYRFRKFSCSRIQGHNGKSALALASANTTGINWIKFSQRKTH